MLLGSLASVKAQWVDNLENNTFVADCSGDDSELYTAAQGQSRVYVNRITPEGEVLWDDGIRVTLTRYMSPRWHFYPCATLITKPFFEMLIIR